MWQCGRLWLEAQWQRAWDVSTTLYGQAFVIALADFADFTPQEIMERRHRAFLQLVLAGCVALLVVFLIIQTLFLRQTAAFMRIAVSCSLLLSVACLRLSFTRWARMAYGVYFSAAFVWMIAYAHLDPSGLSVRTVLAHAYLAPLLLGITLFVPRRFVGWISGALIIIAFASVMLLRVTHSFAPEIRYPLFTSATFLLVLYLLTLALAWGWESSMAAGVTALQQAYLHELALEKSKDEFLHIASHELRSPLTPIILSSQFLERRLREGRPTEELLDLTATIRRGSKRMQTMADILLDITRIDINRFTLKMAQADIAQIVREAALAQQIDRRRAVTLTGVDAPIWLLLDENRIWQVMTNLIANAMKYTPPDAAVAVTVTITAPHVQVAVKDEGPGIPPESFAHLFDRYYQVPDAAERTNEGFGLGLYICRSIIEAHGGEIWVESTPGQGASFLFTLPLTSDDASPSSAT